MKKITDYIKLLKYEKDISKNVDLIVILGSTKGFIGDLINGKKKISTSKCLILAEELKIKPEIILLTMLYEKEKDIESKEKLKKIIQRIEENQ